ncbi:poly(3-hydroxyalkanoate) depolymerase [Sulfitobacter aestuariivivens]|uniref:Poly(3-hydroxyalkanoate) depolymerase n=1 Tax=Sulfitobacter aestuariivivens TaxID=2766981 RepID=A0A927HH72_9RHOB|nr:poly(3-hydroxyalkanoate) depolymerase [Sulfitobacter aestuariivivens]MBD3664975.1 poly(3-hydroxyalkanoate) depolymerase [Sulfitobacter aestuariivivens]
MSTDTMDDDTLHLPKGVRVETLDVRGQRLRVAIKDGDTSKPPLLMFNGIGANLELGFPFLTALKGRRAILFDVPGVGGSPMPGLPYRPSTLARLSKHLLEMLEIDRVDVSGVSWGGGLAQQFAKQYPKICRRLVLVSTSSGWTMVPGKPSVLSKMSSIKRYTDKGYMRSIAAEIYGGAFRRDDTLINAHAAGMRPSSNAGYMLQLLAMTGWTSVPWLWLLKQPTLVVSGTDDPLIPVANARLLAHLIPKARLELIDDGHLFIVTDPSGTAKLVGDFLDDDSV